MLIKPVTRATSQNIKKEESKNSKRESKVSRRVSSISSHVVSQSHSENQSRSFNPRSVSVLKMPSGGTPHGARPHPGRAKSHNPLLIKHTYTPSKVLQAKAVSSIKNFHVPVGTRSVASRSDLVFNQVFGAGKGQVATEMNQLGSNVDFGVGVAAAKILFDNHQYRDLTEVAGAVVKETAQTVVIPGAARVVYSVIKEGTKELLPALGSVFPAADAAVSVLNVFVTAGMAVGTGLKEQDLILGAQKACQAFSGALLPFICATAGQAMIPIPGVGAFLGACVGQYAIREINRFIDDVALAPSRE
jgi:hypothetical protein